MLKNIKAFLLTALMALLLAPTAWADSNNYYAAVTVHVGATGGGKVYVSDQSTRSPNYAENGNTASKSTTTSGGDVTFYVYAQANSSDYRFAGWSRSLSPDGNYQTLDNNQLKVQASTKAAEDKDKPNAASYDYYAHFLKLETGATQTVLAGDSLVLPDTPTGVTAVKSSSTGNATVSRNGDVVTVTGVTAGTTTITVTTPTVEYTYQVTVNPKPETKDRVTLYKDDSFTVAGLSGTFQNQNVTSASTSTATATKSGSNVVITGVAAGDTEVVVTTSTTIYTIPVTVNPIATESSEVIKYVGDAPVQFPESYTGIKDLTNSDPTVATVSQSGGKVTATILKEGETTIFVKASGVEHTYTLKVGPAATVSLVIPLAKGATTAGTYELNLKELRSSTDPTPTGIVTKSVDGNKVTFTAAGASESGATATVTGVETTASDPVGVLKTYNLKFTVKEYDSDVVQIGDGYITYQDASQAGWVGDEYVLVFDSAAQAGNFMVPAPFMAEVDVLAVGGGGAGGTQRDRIGGGGGGAGGFVLKEGVRLMGGTFNVTVGQGGGVPDSNEIATVGANGRPSTLADESGHTVVSALGGGGGGATGVGLYNGASGANGGGGTWYTTSSTEITTNEFGTVSTNLVYNRSVGIGGRGTSGQGSNGGKPAGYNYGAGGGGAGATDGAGVGGVGNTDAPGVGGEGRVSDITGTEVTYAQGGAGGSKDSTAAATAGAGPGFGGDGGNGGLGGAGHDGAVVVRIKRLYQNVKVPVPTKDDALTYRFVWQNGQTFTDFDQSKKVVGSDGNTYVWSDTVDHIDGRVSTTCAGTAENPEGVGSYLYIVYLKDGFSWDDGNPESYGSTSGEILRWVVVISQDTVEATIKITKKVSWNDKENATVTVDTATTPEMIVHSTPKVLFLGTACDGHGLVADTIKKSLKVITQAADVDYFIYGVNSSGNSTVDLHGSYSKGESNKVDNLSISMNAPRHYAMKAFYQCLYTQLSEKEYDYIVFEFDGSRLADSYSKYEKEKEVSELLLPYYASSNVIWVVDNCYSGDNEPWHGKDYWRPNSYYNDGSGHSLNDTRYRGLIGLFDPKNYNESGTRENMSTERKTYNGTTYYANDRYGIQANYSNVEALLDLLRAVIKVKPNNVELTDKIVSPAKGLTIKRVNYKICVTQNAEGNGPSTDDSDWYTFASWNATTGEISYPEQVARPNSETGEKITGTMTVDPVTNEIKVAIDNVDFALYTKLDTDVIDDGTFRTTLDGATYNEVTHVWEKDPNDGEAVVALKEMEEGGKTLMESACSTLVMWTFEPNMVTAEAVHGKVLMDNQGAYTNKAEIGYSDGANSTITYRGEAGYELVSLVVDGQELDFTQGNLASTYTFENIISDHSLVVTYENFVGENYTAPTEYVYDALAHVFEVIPGKWADGREVEVRYSLDPAAEDDEYLAAETFSLAYADNVVKNVGVHENQIFAKIFVNQIGYGVDGNGNPDPTQKGWVCVTPEPLTDKVTITQRELVVTPNYPDPIGAGSDFPTDIGYTVKGFATTAEDQAFVRPTAWKVVSDDYHKGDPVGQYTTRMDGVRTGDVTSDGNYRFVVNPGLLDVVKSSIIIEDVPQGPNLDPDDPTVDTGVDRVEKMYDGLASSITVNVTRPDNPSYYKIQYQAQQISSLETKTEASDSAWQDTNPSFTDVGIYRVWYSVTPTVTETESGSKDWNESYFAVTNYSYVIITKRPITILSEPGEKTYDGTPLTREKWAYKNGSLHVAEKDTLAVTCTGSQTEVGTSKNTMTWSITCNGQDVSGNYEVTEVLGDLTVTLGSIQIGEVDQPTDPDFPLTPGENGVESVEKVYDGQPSHIVVNVTRPTEGYTIKYSTDKQNWSETNPTFKDVGEHTVYYWVTAENYVDVINNAFVIIHPRPVTVQADDQSGVVGETLPTPTAKILPETDEDKGVLPGEENLIVFSTAYGESVPNPPTALGEFTGQIIPSGETTQGNYTVTYVPGTLSVVDKKIVSLWITDHADAGDGYIYLAFKPTLNAGELNAAFISGLATANHICVSSGATEADAKKATPVPVVLRDPNQPLDANGWVWVKVPMPETLSAAGAGPVWLITITE